MGFIGALLLRKSDLGQPVGQTGLQIEQAPGISTEANPQYPGALCSWKKSEASER